MACQAENYFLTQKQRVFSRGKKKTGPMSKNCTENDCAGWIKTAHSQDRGCFIFKN
jgi:hypothetical protein